MMLHVAILPIQSEKITKTIIRAPNNLYPCRDLRSNFDIRVWQIYDIVVKFILNSVRIYISNQKLTLVKLSEETKMFYILKVDFLNDRA